MRLRFLPCVAAIAAAPLLVAPARADDSFDASVRDVLGGDPGQYRAVVTGFQAALRAGDARTAATFVSFPLTATIDGAHHRIKDAAAFVAAYPRIVTPAIAAAVASEDPGDMLVNDQGVMLGTGEVWITGICDAADTGCAHPEVKVITIQPTDAPLGNEP